MRFSAVAPDRAAVAGLCIALTLGAAACGTTADQPGGVHTKGDSTSTALPSPKAGRLVRILGNGQVTALDGPAPAVRSGVAQPMGLAVSASGALVGWQSGFSAASQLITVSPQGLARAVPDLGKVKVRPAAPHSGWSLATREVGGRLAVVHRSDDVELVDPGSGAVVGHVALPKDVPSIWSASWLPARDGAADHATLRYGDRWFTLDASTPSTPTLRPVNAPVAGAVAAVPTAAGGALVLTPTSLVTLSAQGAATRTVRFALPATARGDSVTGAAALPDGGLVLTATAPPDGGAGQVLRVTAGGTVSVLARGTGSSGPGSDCADADTAAADAHLTLPMSVAVWHGRIVVADTTCSSVLQLPLP